MNNELAMYSTELQCLFHESQFIPLCSFNSELAEYTIKNNKHHVLSHILTNHTFDNKTNQFLAEYAVECDSLLSIQVLFENGCIDFESNGMKTIVIDIIREGSIEIFDYMLDNFPVDFDDYSGEYIKQAIRTADLYKTQRLLDHDSVMCFSWIDENESLIESIRYRDYDMVYLLLYHPKIDPHFPHNEPLNTATECDEHDIARLIHSFI